MNQPDKLEILKDILFTDDRAYAEKIAKRIEILEQNIEDSERLSAQVNPIVNKELKEFVENIPHTLGPTITETLKEEIKNHKDEVVDALYPVLGKMIKKYVAQEMKMLSESINNQLSKRFSAKGMSRRFRSWFGNVSEEELLLSEISSAKIEQVLLIEKDSGILKGSFSKRKTIDEDMISGMLTAIKSFVEDAFNQKNQNLELIEYELYQIHLQSFVTHYIAVVISGNYDLKSKNKVQDIIFNFYNSFMAMNLDLVFASSSIEISAEPVTRKKIEKELSKSFGNEQI
ncbi:cell envelope biogenesis protein OmpA [uncultured Maribacter sp.]|uniref:cell envelope biogenesis protein OmpA n=1 Tax=uncultured Maribacter sp. TaxID=431308 RepID=UPI0026376816|nr:cell envelope biogenesis protein OmpA [uncultured Maribacter sp.]